MVLKLRLARFGRRHTPVYNIVLAQARSARDSRPIEVLGTYDPTPRTPLASNNPPATSQKNPQTQPLTPAPPSQSSPATQASQSSPTAESQDPPQKRYKSITLDQARTKYWLGVGAQPSEPVARLLALMGLVEAKPGTTREGRERNPEC